MCDIIIIRAPTFLRTPPSCLSVSYQHTMLLLASRSETLLPLGYWFSAPLDYVTFIPTGTLYASES